MKKQILFLIFVCISFVSNGQLKLIKQKNKDLKITEVFEIKKDSPLEKNGSYTKYLSNEISKKLLIEKGQYIKGQRVGVWDFFDFYGDLSLRYNFENDSIIIYNSNNAYGLKENRPLFYLGSRSEIEHIIAVSLKIPPRLIGSGAIGRVIVKITIEKDGDVSSYKILKGMSTELDKVAIETVKNIPKSWLPAIKNGEPVSSSVNVPITFVL